MGLDVEVIATDRSPSIRKIMRLEHPEIKHEFDIWHTAKGWLLFMEGVVVTCRSLSENDASGSKLFTFYSCYNWSAIQGTMVCVSILKVENQKQEERHGDIARVDNVSI